MTPEQQGQVDRATDLARGMASKGQTEAEVLFALRQDGYHVTPRRIALATVFKTERAMQKLADLGQEWEAGE